MALPVGLFAFSSRRWVQHGFQQRKKKAKTTRRLRVLGEEAVMSLLPRPLVSGQCARNGWAILYCTAQYRWLPGEVRLRSSPGVSGMIQWSSDTVVEWYWYVPFQKSLRL